MNDLPAPLTPADCDLRDFQFMPVDIVRLLGSRFHAIATDAEWRAGVTLWLKSFHQVPAGSLPDDEVELCRLAELGRDHKAWRKIRAGALYGWKKCSDNRLYHPVVCEKAVEAFSRKQQQRERSRRANESRWGGGNGGNPDKAAGNHIPQASHKDAVSIPVGLLDQSSDDPKGQGQGQGQGQGDSSSLRDVQPADGGLFPTASPEAKSRSVVKRASAIPSDWAPDQAGVDFAVARGVDARSEVQRFRDYHMAKGSLMKDWAAAWRTWCGNAQRFAGNGRQTRPPDSRLTAMEIIGGRPLPGRAPPSHDIPSHVIDVPPGDWNEH